MMGYMPHRCSLSGPMKQHRDACTQWISGLALSLALSLLSNNESKHEQAGSKLMMSHCPHQIA